MEVREVTASVFHEFSLHHPQSTFYQSVPFTEIKRNEGWEVYYLCGFENDECIAGSAIVCDRMFGKYMYCCAVKGFLLDYGNRELVQTFTKGVVSFLKQHNGLYLRINPAFLYKEHDASGACVEGGFDHHSYVENLIHAGFTHEGFPCGFPENQHVRWTFVLPLEKEDENSLKKKMSKLTQRNLKNADKYHVVVKEIQTKEDLDIFFKIMKHTADRRSFSTFTKEYYEEQFAYFHPEGMVKFLYAELHADAYAKDLLVQMERSQKKIAQQEQMIAEKGISDKLSTKLAQEQEVYARLCKKHEEIQALIAEKGSVFPIATANFMMYHQEITYFHGGSYNEYMHFCGQFALQWYMMQYGLQHGFTRYNFNGISGIFDESAPDYGVYTFKKGFGGHVEEYPGYFHMPIRILPYRCMQIAGKVKRIFKKGA